MKHLFLVILLLPHLWAMGQQSYTVKDPIVITLKSKRGIALQENENGNLEIKISEKDLQNLKKKGYVRYSDMGAKGDGKTDDMDAIAAAHALANRENLSVKADKDAVYYIGRKARTAIIQTDTDFGTAEFVINDTKVADRTQNIFDVTSVLKPYNLTGISSLKRKQRKIDVPLPGPSLITVTDSNVRRYIRFGPNQNNGSAQTDIFMVDKDGNVDINAPIIWDFDQITEITAIPIDETTLTIRGGKFTTIANQAESKYTY